jgi:eukaryotic-like serine/threonine-protein kinase
MSALREGDRINNYLLDRIVGAGSFGEVWRARHQVFDQVVAIKIPTDPQYVRNLQREGVAIHGLNDANIVRAIDMDPYGDPPYLVMEFIDGPSLREAIDHAGAAFPVDSAIVIVRGILRALAAAHKAGIVHRDVKPANILLTLPVSRLDEVSEECVKVTDFGLGSIGGSITQSLMQSGSVQTEQGKSIAGTWAYMSPEQKQGLEVDGRSDLYSCGVILFELLTGERPQGFDLPGALRSDVPSWLDDVVRRCYARLEQRFTSAEEMLVALSPNVNRGQHLDTTVPPLPPDAKRVASGNTGATCPSCNMGVEKTDQFCIRCGHQLVEAVPQCPSCDSTVHYSDRFCIFCGKDLGRLR